uniref:Uncharacterized protein n=1 Tax=Cacopsylla melanoneura TaxID=428564 RepID=A0A8D9DW55_9HEMI
MFLFLASTFHNLFWILTVMDIMKYTYTVRLRRSGIEIHFMIILLIFQQISQYLLGSFVNMRAINNYQPITVKSTNTPIRYIKNIKQLNCEYKMVKIYLNLL